MLTVPFTYPLYTVSCKKCSHLPKKRPGPVKMVESVHFDIRKCLGKYEPSFPRNNFCSSGSQPRNPLLPDRNPFLPNITPFLLYRNPFLPDITPFLLYINPFLLNIITFLLYRNPFLPDITPFLLYKKTFLPDITPFSLYKKILSYLT